MIKVLIADDHAVVRKGVRKIIEEHPDIEVIAEAVDGTDVLSKLHSLEVDMVILDITMPNINGLEVLKRLENDFPKLDVLILSMHAEDQYAVRAMKAGASGYLTKDSVPELLITAIRKIASGEKYVSNKVTEELIFELDKDREKLPHQLLSDREFQVLLEIGAGKKRSQIATEMLLSVKTIDTYRARILEKMRLNNNIALTSYLLQHGLLTIK